MDKIKKVTLNKKGNLYWAAFKKIQTLNLDLA